MPDEYGIQSVPPRYDEYNSYYIHTSEGYQRAVEEIEAEERETAEAEIKEETRRAVTEEELKRAEEYNREQEKAILEEIRLKEQEMEAQRADISEYSDREESPPGTRLDLLA